MNKVSLDFWGKGTDFFVSFEHQKQPNFEISFEKTPNHNKLQ
jgi:hypothetical protein